MFFLRLQIKLGRIELLFGRLEGEIIQELPVGLGLQGTAQEQRRWWPSQLDQQPLKVFFLPILFGAFGGSLMGWAGRLTLPRPLGGALSGGWDFPDAGGCLLGAAVAAAGPSPQTEVGGEGRRLLPGARLPQGAAVGPGGRGRRAAEAWQEARQAGVPGGGEGQAGGEGEGRGEGGGGEARGRGGGGAGAGAAAGGWVGGRPGLAAAW